MMITEYNIDSSARFESPDMYITATTTTNAVTIVNITTSAPASLSLQHTTHHELLQWCGRNVHRTLT